MENMENLSCNCVSVTKLSGFGQIGNVVRANCSWRFFLEPDPASAKATVLCRYCGRPALANNEAD